MKPLDHEKSRRVVGMSGADPMKMPKIASDPDAADVITGKIDECSGVG
jgi:hypothetical protein